MRCTELPPCEGPKLHRFAFPRAAIRWIERIDQGDEGALSFVFKAEIKEKLYAIKVFPFYNPLDTQTNWGVLVKKDFPLDQAAYYTDPFFNECRAYGRVKETIRKKKPSMAFVVPCHGYLLLSPAEEEKIQKLDPTVDFGRDRVDNALQRKMAGGTRVRAIVKDLVSNSSGVTSGTICCIYRGLKNLNKAGIFYCDVSLRNFRDCKAVDFGSSWTEPHKMREDPDKEWYGRQKLVDMSRFDQMVEDEGFKTTCVGVHQSREYRKKLRDLPHRTGKEYGRAK